MANLSELHVDLCEILLKHYKDSEGEPDLRAAHPYLHQVEVSLDLCKYARDHQDQAALRSHAQNLIKAIQKINAAPTSYTPSLRNGEYACPFKAKEWYNKDCRPIMVDALMLANEAINFNEPSRKRQKRRHTI